MIAAIRIAGKAFSSGKAGPIDSGVGFLTGRKHWPYWRRSKML